MSERAPFEQFFAYRRLLPLAEITPDGERVLFASNLSGQFNLWSVAVDAGPGGGGWPEQLTSFADRTVRSAAVREDGTILFSADGDGDEFMQLYRIPAGGGWPEQLTDLASVQHFLGANAWAPDGRSFAFSANSRTPADTEVFLWLDDEAEPRQLFGEGRYTFAAAFSPDGARLLVADFRSNMDTSLFVVDVATGESVEATPHEGEAKFFPGPWAGDGSGFHLLTYEGREFVGVAFHELASGRREWVADPERDVDELAGSADGRMLAWIENDDGWSVLRVRDLERGVELPAPRLPRGTVPVAGSGLSLSADGRRLALLWD